MEYHRLSPAQKTDVVLKSFVSKLSKSKFSLSQHIAIESLDAWRKLFIAAGTQGFSRQQQYKTIPIQLYEATNAIVEMQKKSNPKTK
jgi:hypothetical protein